MAARNEFVSHVRDLLTPAGQVTVRRMFSGHGLYVDRVFIAIVVGDELYLKTDDLTRADFEAEGCTPFMFQKDGKPMVTSYLRAPGEAMDAPHLMLPWARRALAAAVRARAKKAAPKNKPAAKKKTSRPAIKKRAA